ncbi:UDP-2,4-diacetamido-2,4,6-trideoxy-beta-L-altropyranose hydrolase [Psychrobacillus vulpis]|uniref:UDP-2,4-diacetamido-2,4, 6-trideoxy-beta-L-altropyranose hydrolase n=1 Tax=Psychrobacillus vulpis TaxID=2325572 RepID=A0A544TIU7_9BACI|nr:UDP-2,4-diacetamido-2,4,6-trideoxy-beta-L-altropyranose hydrolase [Psychrobacillus vulpis]TQR17382.1 UDP-2,4-diacetamido-2,4,6-trideoxy-beta-L-altropyranose hydrolase [Psychrobacillus vulpis]
MKVVIRTDASIEIGTGHVMRCVTLAKQLRNRGATVTFVCRDFPGNSIKFIEREEFDVVSLSCEEKQDNVQWVKLNWQQDADDTKSILKGLCNETDLLVVDHYGIDIQWEAEVRLFVSKIMVIDDLADRKHECDLLLDQNYYLDKERRYMGLVPNNCVQMLGPDYLLLREEFIETVKISRERTGQIRNILIFFGGTDPTGETIKVLDAIKQMALSGIEINVVVGTANPNVEKVKKICSQMVNTNFFCQISNMAELMNMADLAIGAGGSTTWERCLLGLPAITVTIADNQQELTEVIANQGAIINLGDISEFTKESIQNVMLELLQNQEKVKLMSEKCAEFVSVSSVKKRQVIRKVMELLL